MLLKPASGRFKNVEIGTSCDQSAPNNRTNVTFVEAVVQFIFLRDHISNVYTEYIYLNPELLFVLYFVIFFMCI